MVHLEKINAKNVWKIVNLHVSAEQDDFVATNAQSLIEAYLAVANNGVALPFGIFADDTPVGFLMIGYGVDDEWEAPPQIARGNYNFWRFMIDQQYQHRGYGREAFRLALEFIRTLPCGPAEYCYLSYEPENEVAKKLYASFGFQETGEMDEDEIIAALKL